MSQKEKMQKADRRTDKETNKQTNTRPLLYASVIDTDSAATSERT